MNRPRSWVWVGISVMALMGLGASSASALEWRTEFWGSPLGGLEENFSASGGSMVLKAAGVTVTCKKSTGAGKLAFTAKARLTKFVFSECSANFTCTVASSLETLSLKGEAIEGIGKTYTGFAPEGKTWLEITFGGAECALEGKQPVTGAACFEGPATGVYAVNFPLATPPIGFSCLSSLKVGANAATLELKTQLKLTGTHVGEAWGLK